ncbi:MAG TPA: serine protease [Caulobacteraceae bacterium]
MRFRPPDWLLYVLGVLVLLALSMRREDAEAPPAPDPPSEAEGLLLAPETPFDPAVVVEAPSAPLGPVSGTAFAIAEGRWLTARHVVEGCSRAAIVVGGGRAVAAAVRLAPRADVALLTTEGGPPALPLVLDQPLRIGQRAFHHGFPQGRPGEATSRLLGRETLHVMGRGKRQEPVLAWAEVGRTAGLNGTLSGLSGAPALDREGEVIGVTVAEAPRRGRIYTTAPESLAEALGGGSGRRGGGPSRAAVTIDNYGRIADDLRRDLRVAQVVCMPGRT